MLDRELNYIYGLNRLGIKPGLAVINRLLSELGKPHQSLKYVHITGTNGKGSVAAMISSVMQAAGYKTGLYTSPHLYSFNERIRISGDPISNLDLLHCIQLVKEAAGRADVAPTFFEFTTALAFLYFAEQKVDIAVVEVGVGGDWDATNVITPLVSIITNVSLDHTDLLGKTERAIARRKAGIIKPGVPVVVGDVGGAPLQEIIKVSLANKSSVVKAIEEVKIKRLTQELSGQEVLISGPFEAKAWLPLLGDHQLKNLQVAVAGLGQLKRHYNITATDMVAGIGRVSWPGRLEVISRHPLIIVDGAHNNDGMLALHKFLQGLAGVTDQKIRYDVLILGVKKGKDLSLIAGKIIPMFKHIILTEGSYQPEPVGNMARQLTDFNNRIILEPNPKRAVERGLKLLTGEGTMLACGSLYMVADVLPALKQQAVLA